VWTGLNQPSIYAVWRPIDPSRRCLARVGIHTHRPHPVDTRHRPRGRRLDLGAIGRGRTRARRPAPLVLAATAPRDSTRDGGAGPVVHRGGSPRTPDEINHTHDLDVHPPGQLVQHPSRSACGRRLATLTRRARRRRRSGRPAGWLAGASSIAALGQRSDGRVRSGG
jgi:hypothetical protein